MIPVRIDLGEVLSGFSLTRSEVSDITQATVEAVTFAIYNEVLNLASTELRSTRRIYRANVNFPIIEKYKGTIVLTGALPNMLEQGADAFDMKTGFSKSPKRKPKANGGWYLTIPFRWATPEAIADNEAFSNQLDTPLYNLLKKKVMSPMRQTSQGIAKSSSQPITLEDLRQMNRAVRKTRGARVVQGKKFAAYTHKSPIEQGVRKEKRLYENALQSKYVSFRRVSDNSNENSWIHGGLQARNFMPRAAKNVDKEAIAARTIDSQLSNLGI